MYVLVRNDISASQQAVQAIHAAVEAARFGLIPKDIDHPHLVLCSIEPSRLLEYAESLEYYGVSHKVFHEPDLGGIMTALATSPLSGKHRKLFQNCPLLSGVS